MLCNANLVKMHSSTTASWRAAISYCLLLCSSAIDVHNYVKTSLSFNSLVRLNAMTSYSLWSWGPELTFQGLSFLLIFTNCNVSWANSRKLRTSEVYKLWPGAYSLLAHHDIFKEQITLSIGKIFIRWLKIQHDLCDPKRRIEHRTAKLLLSHGG